MSNASVPHLLVGGIANDARGSVGFVNSFHFDGVKRFYVIENAQVGLPRAWHGHHREEKHVFVAAGSAVICAADMNTGRVLRFELDADAPAVLYIPAGWANGSMALEPGTKILHFSTVTLEESENDDERFPLDAFADVWHDTRSLERMGAGR